ncbi:hypothetical protein PR202_ga16079 [Eleusine coracana subsp. coracana]|uniref:Sulfite exporter TauE/SafE family protein n=1 Tax=Eleusine coracana subsp. coracana TaxID=191504 RepID=A0AAV5CM70_ELECO|nr:hypothetical protein PR202_ga16079 [Eleusine coracana subsp. coracana]
MSIAFDRAAHSLTHENHVFPDPTEPHGNIRDNKKMGKTLHLQAVAALGVVACAAAMATLAVAADTGLPSGAVVARNVTGKTDGSSYHHVWPPMQFGWRIMLGSLIGFFGAAFGSVGGVGGGGIFVPMLALIIGFDPKSSIAMSKCMIMGASVSTVYYNLKLKHPTLDVPLVDYDLALLIQPMLMLGVSIGVIFNVIFPDWLVTALLIIIFLVTSTKAFLKGVETWKKETIAKRVRNQSMQQVSLQDQLLHLKTPIILLVFLFIFVELHIFMLCAILGLEFTTGLVGGLLGLGGGFIMGPLFLELGIPPQVSSATATFAMMFSSSMSVVEYYLLHRFPMPYAAYFTAVAFIAAIIGQHFVRRLIKWLGRASLIIFILASMIFISAILLGTIFYN